MVHGGSRHVVPVEGGVWAAAAHDRKSGFAQVRFERICAVFRNGSFMTRRKEGGTGKMRRQQTQATEVHAYVRIEEFKELKCYLSLFSIWLFARPPPPFPVPWQ